MIRFQVDLAELIVHFIRTVIICGRQIVVLITATAFQVQWQDLCPALLLFLLSDISFQLYVYRLCLALSSFNFYF
jgi:hypothetical protein